MERIRVFFVVFVLALYGCNQHKKNKVIFGNDFELFDGTTVEELAGAVQDQDVLRIRRILNQKNIDVDFQERRYGHTLLMVATMNNLDVSVFELLKQGADPDLRDKSQSESAFLHACSRNMSTCNPRLVKNMISFGADLDSAQIFEEKTDRGMHTNINCTPLMIALDSECDEIAKLLIAKGADIDKYTYYPGYGALTVAIENDNLRIAKYLIMECKAKIPEFCYIRNEGEPSERRLTITEFLQEKAYDPESENSRLRREIIHYLNNL